MSRCLQDLLAQLHYTGIRRLRDALISGIEYDSRRVEPGDLFVAIQGRHSDGHEHIPEAIERGAVAIVGERPAIELPANVTYIAVENSRRALADLACAFYDHPTEKLFTVGVTGTKGKTSVTHLSAAVMGLEETEVISTVTNALQRGHDQTTPEAAHVQQIAWEALHSGRSHLAMEASAHGLSQERVRGVAFAAAVFTNLSHDHLDYYGDLEQYLQAKLKLFRQLSPEATAIVNRDDALSHRVMAACSCRVWTYGLTSQADIWADQLELGPDASRAWVHTPVGSFPLRLRFPGIVYVQNALAAVGVGLVRGLPLPLIQERLESVRHIEGRMERFSTRAGFTVVIDFAHSPDSLRKTLQTLRPYCRRLINVFGCGGDSDRLKRPVMGAISGRWADYTILTSDNPKGEDPEAIVREIEAGLQTVQAPYESRVDRREAIQRALFLASPGDCVLIAGKGHERTQIFKTHQIPFNDKEYLRELGVIAPQQAEA
jgi:UDP-N-acetylmuramoyl-L-alanyl-D-glutamate--2,6-diaminopimelate ligase